MIVMVRHAEADKAKGRAIGHTDLNLSPEGLKQAGMLAEALADTRFKTFLCSPLKRTMQTAMALQDKWGTSPVPCPELAEIDLGEWDGLSFEKIRADYPEEYLRRGQDITAYHPPGGENFIDLKERVSILLQRLSTQDSPAILVTHAGVIRVIMHIALGFPLENIFHITPAHCHASIMVRQNTGYILKGYNLPPGQDLSSFINKLMQQRT
ncbi:histidine phosphatase family protein [Maridesulfovibrio sp. FT414]|uniref:histidine phosphatase family protein n=1 Tax=Maridesulfovibrio sp. FT414 TaxID=2979469 RepID=UPI003D808999